LGILVALGFGGPILGDIILLAVAGGMILAFRNRKGVDVRRWVMWAFIVIDAIIALAIVRQWV